MRSPLAARFADLFALRRRARLTGVPTGELLDSERGALSRRRLLGRGAAIATAFALPGLASAADLPRRGQPTIAIIGAGIAGLTCAFRLWQRGIAATVYEASDRLGGRMWSARGIFADGQVAERGGEFIDTWHVTMRRLASELAIDLVDIRDDDRALSGLVGRFDGRRLGDAEILAGFAPIADAIDHALRHVDEAVLDRYSIAAWFDLIGAHGPVRELLEVAYTIEFGLDPRENNVLNMMYLISTGTQRFRIFGDSDERFQTVGGNDLFISRLAERLPQPVRTGHALEALTSTSDGRFAATFRRGAGTRTEVVADHVVLALPFSILRQVPLTGIDLPPAKRQAIDEIGYGQSTKLMCGTRRRVWRAQGSDGQSFSDLPYQNSWDTSRMQPGSSGILTNFTGGTRALAVATGTPVARAAEFLGQIEAVYPGITSAHDGRVLRQRWNDQPWVRASYSSYRPGQYAAFAGSEQERVGNLHFCGEHCTMDAQGYMEGGALTGELAAAEIVADTRGAPIAVAAAPLRRRRQPA